MFFNGNYYGILGLYWDNGKENGNYYSILGFFIGDNGKENGSSYSILGFLTFMKKGSVFLPRVMLAKAW